MEVAPVAQGIQLTSAKIIESGCIPYVYGLLVSHKLRCKGDKIWHCSFVIIYALRHSLPSDLKKICFKLHQSQKGNTICRFRITQYTFVKKCI